MSKLNGDGPAGQDGSNDPVIEDLGVVGASFAPSVSKVTDVIKAVVDDDFTMDDLIITDDPEDCFEIQVQFTQGVGGDILSWDSSKFVGGDLIPLSSIGLSIGTDKIDILTFRWDEGLSKWLLVGFVHGIAE